VSHHIRIVDITHVERIGKLDDPRIGKPVEALIKVRTGLGKLKTCLFTQIGTDDGKSPRGTHDHDPVSSHGWKFKSLGNGQKVPVITDPDDPGFFEGGIDDVLIAAEGSGVA